ncbi:MAG: tRNA(Ile)(2)-agmatinylcytidine synthase [Candidatus Nezhaarchaeota archaeon]|nr:tRNA(Ile)(2)-agmatinylcytidine synthase [Candidatus Nezhaarchaeota archaeon]MCX8142005.1 tRNA(Ile)(2)-agmatinylcytidine synthase [Candidatus Nezhaarchaeota archaeon]MDW8050214.1 tRNA(Ile)(2)-agmatinylcytidine synthase [Nitrososphaerota archaeon]
MSYELLHIGMDDIDSWHGGCTTYFAFEVLRDSIKRFSLKLLDYPLLTRLNPNIPWKTRGNGAVCLRVKISSNELMDFIEFLELKLRSYTEGFYDADPVIAILIGDLSDELENFYRKALTRVVTLREAIDIAQRNDVKVIATRSRMGLIGSLASIGSLMHGDHTYELLAYRAANTKREIDHDSVWLMDFLTWPYTFNNIDPEVGRMLITPHGPDPVLFGIRGENPGILLKALRIIKVHGKLLGYMVFRSNQGTDCHYLKIEKIEDLQPYSSISLKGEVACRPTTLKGGHVVFKVAVGRCEVWCVAYKPSGEVRRVAEKLEVGDMIEVYGGVRRFPGSDVLSLNLEKIVVVRTCEKTFEKNPSCPRCQKTLKSLGKRGGFKCERCGFKTLEKRKVVHKIQRESLEGIYLPPPRSMRHLAKPFRRYGLEKDGSYMLQEVEIKEVLYYEQ